MNQETIEKGKGLAVLSYLTIFGVIIAFFLNNDKKNAFASFHIRQSLGLWLTFFLIGYFVGMFNSWLMTVGFWIFFGVLFIFGFMTALTGRATATPLLGDLYQRIFSSLGK